MTGLGSGFSRVDGHVCGSMAETPCLVAFGPLSAITTDKGKAFAMCKKENQKV